MLMQMVAIIANAQKFPFKFSFNIPANLQNPSFCFDSVLCGRSE